MYSTMRSQRTSLLSAPTLNPINWSGDWSEPAAVRRSDAASAQATSRQSTPEKSRRGRVRSMSKNRPGLLSETTMQRTLGARTRMDAIQAPIVAVIGDLIRQVPGTISLGQGVVHYGPPPEAIDAVRSALERPDTHQYNDGHGIPALVRAVAAKLASENRIDVGRG